MVYIRVQLAVHCRRVGLWLIFLKHIETLARQTIGNLILLFWLVYVCVYLVDANFTSQYKRWFVSESARVNMQIYLTP